MKNKIKRVLVMFVLGCMIITYMPNLTWADTNTGASGDSKDENTQTTTDPAGGAGDSGGGGMPAADSAPDESAVYVEDGAEATDKEYADATQDVTFDEDGTAYINNQNFESDDYSYNGVVATGANSIVKLRNCTFDLDVGSPVDSDAEDGCAVAVDDGATMYISQSDLTVHGAGRYTTSNYNDGTLIVNDSSVTSTGSNENTTAISDPRSNAALLISGTARANFSVGQSKTYYFNSDCTAEGWAALSTDSATGNGLDLYAYNTTATAEDGGYGTYADTNCRVWLYGSILNAAEIGAIISKTGSIFVGDGDEADDSVLQYNEGNTTTAGTVISGGRNAVMMHAPDMMGEGASAASTGELTVKDSSLVTTKNLVSTKDYSDYGEATGAYVDYISGADILVKSTSANITLDNATLDSYSDVLVQTVINSDGMGNFLDEADGATVDPVTVNMENMEATGDIEHMDYQRRMTLNLTDATLNGAVVSGTFEDWSNLWSDYTAENGYEGTDVNWLPDSSWDTVYGVSMNLGEGAVWNVTGESTLSSLTVAEDAQINGLVTVDGEAVSVEPGTTYTGTIVVYPQADAQGSITIDSVTVDNSLTPSAQVSNITQIVYTMSGLGQQTINLTEDEKATLTIDGIQKNIYAGAVYDYTDVDTTGFTLTQKGSLNECQSGGPGGLHTFYITAAAYIVGNEILSDYSVDKAISGDYDGDSAENVEIYSDGDFFNGIYLEDCDYSINGLKMVLNGNGGNDFDGWGAGITVKGDSDVSINNADITSTGAIRTAIWAGGSSTLNVTNSIVRTYGADTLSQSYEDLTVPMMKHVPWALGLLGNIRATNVLGSATANYTDSIVVSDGWGALSTDSGKTGTNALNADNVFSGIGYIEEYQEGEDYDAVTELNGTKYGFTIANSGYVTYADSGVYNNYNNVKFYAPDYIMILASQTSSANYTGDDTVAVSNRIGAMWHQNKGGTLNLTDGTWSAEDIMFLAKSGSANSSYPILNVDDTTLNLTGDEDYSGVLYQLMESDDAGGIFPTTYTIPEIENDWSQITPVEEETTAAQANFKDVDVDGDIYNSVYNINQDLDVTFDDSEITGVISSSNANHVDEDGTVIAGGTVVDQSTDDDAYLYAGRIENTASEAVNNDVNLDLTDTTWTVTGTSYVSELTLDEDSEIVPEYGYELTATVDGEPVSLDAGTYEDVVISVSEVVPETPSIVRQPKAASYKIGANANQLSVRATVSEGTLSYQWYQSSTDSTESGTIINGATNASYRPTTSTAGTTYYYAVITNTYQGKTASAVTQTAKIIVNKLQQKIYCKQYYMTRVGNKQFSLGASLKKGDGKLTYTSSNSKVVKVDSKGKVTVVGSGTATITITAKETSKYASATKTVTVTVMPKTSWNFSNFFRLMTE